MKLLDPERAIRSCHLAAGRLSSKALCEADHICRMRDARPSREAFLRLGDLFLGEAALPPLQIEILAQRPWCRQRISPGTCFAEAAIKIPIELLVPTIIGWKKASLHGGSHKPNRFTTRSCRAVETPKEARHSAIKNAPLTCCMRLLAAKPGDRAKRRQRPGHRHRATPLAVAGHKDDVVPPRRDPSDRANIGHAPIGRPR